MNKPLLYIIFLFIAGSVLSCNAPVVKVAIWEHFYSINSFTPNNDGLNDQYQLKPHPGVYFTKFHAGIYNADLKLVNELNSVNETWSPGNDELVMPTGYYQLQLTYTASTDSIVYTDYLASSSIYLYR